MALFPNMFYEPLLTPGLLGALDPMEGLTGGGPAFVDFAPGAMPEQVSMLPFAPEAPAPQPMLQNAAPPVTPPIMAASAAPPQPQSFVAAAPVGIGQGESGIPAGGFSAVDFANMLSTAPGAAGNTIDFETGARYGLTPTGLATRDGQQGVYLNTEQGWRHSAGLGDTASGFIAADPNTQYRLTDERGSNTVAAQGSGLAGLMDIRNTASKLNLAGKKANWGLERLNPATGQWDRIAENNPTTMMDQLGPVLDIALPVALSFAVPGLGVIGGKLGAAVGAAAGSGLSSVAQGRSLEDTLLRSAISGGASLAGSAIGSKVGGALSKPVSEATSQTISQVAAPTVAQTVAASLPEIVVQKSLPALLGAKIGSVAGTGLSSQLANMAPGKGADYADRVFEQPTTPAVQMPSPLDTVGNPINVFTNRVPVGGPFSVASAGTSVMAQAGLDAAQKAMERQAAQERENEIVVPGDRITNMAGGTPSFGTVPFTPSLFGNLPPAMPEATPNEIVVTNKPEVPSIPVAAPLPYTPTVTPPVDTGITVTGERPGQFDFPDELAALPPMAAIPTVAGGQFGDPTPKTPDSGNSLLDDIIKYYSLGSAGLDLLGGALGGGGGGAGQMTPYVSQLGPMPTFTRGAMTPFGGDYETYGFGPEFNFFGGAPTPVPSAPAFGLLPPAANPNFGLV